MTNNNNKTVTVSENKKDIAIDYLRNIKQKNPALYDALKDIAKFALASTHAKHTPTKSTKALHNYLKQYPEIDPRISGDTHGVRLFIEFLAKDPEISGNAKRFYQSTLDALLKNQFGKNANEQKIKKFTKRLLQEEIEPLTEEVTRKPMMLPMPEDIKKLASIFNKAGYELYIVGGAVRDALLGKTPKDYDLTTNATPEEILEMLKLYNEYKTLEIGKSFGVINVITPSNEEYEIATFRSDIGKGRRPDAVEFTTIEQDVIRRDLTINALFYDISKQEVVDYVGGIEDIENGKIKTVGSPEDRFDEDRLRILRAIRFAARTGAGLDEETENAILKDNSLDGISAERIRDEFIKSIKSAKSVLSLFRMYETFDLWKQIFPGLKINTWYKETNNLPVLLANLLKNNDPKTLKKKLNDLKYSVDENRKIVFLVMFQEMKPDDALKMKKLYNTTGLKDSDLKEFASLAGNPKQNIVKAFIEYIPSIKGEDLLTQGFKGKELGDELARLEKEKFESLM